MFWDTVKGQNLADAMWWYFRNNTDEWEEYSILIENEPLSEIHKLLQERLDNGDRYVDLKILDTADDGKRTAILVLKTKK